MKLKYSIAVILTISASIAATGQELNSEFTVTHEVVPEERAATRLHLLPVIDLPAVNAGRLPMSVLVNAAPFSPVGVGLEPAPWQTALSRWPWRGYASLNYGPLYNLDASAGYRYADTKNLTADAFMQFNGFKYGSKHPDKAYRVYGKQHLHRNTFTAGTRLAWCPIAGASLTAAADYSFSAYNIPMPIVDKTLTPPGPFANPEDCLMERNFVNHNGVNLSLGWNHRATDKLTYAISGSYGLTAFSRYPHAADENRGTVGASVRYDHGKVSHWLIGVDAQILRERWFGHKGVLSIHPAYVLTLNRFEATIGLKVDWRLGNILNFDILGDRPSGWIYPDLKLNWRPSSKFDLWAKFDGRTDCNSMASLFEAQPYNFPLAYSPMTVTNVTDGTTSTYLDPLGYSRIYNLEAGFTLGPWRGASITAFGGFHSASGWLTPAVRTGFWEARDVHGLHYGLALAYSYRKYLDLSARLEFASGMEDNFDEGYYLWRDHARMDLNVSADTRPIEPLCIRLAYHLRTRRAKPLPGGFSQDLGDISDLDASVSYDLTDRWSVSLRGENLLNHIYYLGPAIPAQGIRGMIGASYKF